LLGKLLGGRYELIEKVGGGGMAVVYKARCHLLKRYVAVKILRPELVENEEFVLRFKRESQSVASLSHPNIVNIYDVGQEGDIHYIVMEYIDGKTLKEYIREKGRLEPEEAVRICIQICQALSHAHKNGIVHRDIKPQNILISNDGDVKVADFGIARAATTATVTMAGSNVIGSVHYFSPEQARGGIVGHQSDIYSLGIVLYEMVTGVVPFEGDSAITVALKHIQEKITPVGDINPEIPKSLQYIIEKATEKDISLRYRDTAEMLRDLRRALKEPDDNFVSKDMEKAAYDEQNTQVMPPIVLHEDRLERKKKKNDETKRKKRTALITILSVLFISGLILTLALVGTSIFRQHFGAGESEVPKVEGYDLKFAETIAKSSNLKLQVIGRQHSNEVPKNYIISQKPRPGMRVKTNSIIEVIVSDGVKMVKVPDVRNKLLRTAEIELENAGLTVGEPIYVYSDKPSGYVVDQSIKGNTEVEEGTEIILTISKGPELVGNYVGFTEEAAKQMIINDGFEVGEVKGEHSSEYAKGIVIRQDPAQGEQIREDRRINLWISLGPEPDRRLRLKIDIPGIQGFARIKVVRISDDTVIYNNYHDFSQGPAYIDVEGKGKVDYDIYIDDIWFSRETIDFSKEEPATE